MDEGADGATAAAPGYLVSSFEHGDPEPIYCAWEEFSAGSRSCPNTNFLKGVRWAPDGSCCLTVSDDNWLRVFDLPREFLQQQQPQQPQQQPQQGLPAAASDGGGDGDGGPPAPAGAPWPSGLAVHAGETVYDYCWFSRMSVADPLSCCFASSSRGQPIKVWDACSGSLRATYRAYDDADEVVAATAVAFSPDGARLVGGFSKGLRVFDVGRPGRDSTRIVTQRRRQEGSVPGIVSCLAFSPVHDDLMAAGSYGRAVGVFDARTHEQQLLLQGHRGGLTQVSFSPDGNFLYSGARQDGQVLCWDVRHTGAALYSLRRATEATNQRIGFSIEPCGRHLATGGCDGNVRVFDLRDGSEAACFRAAADTVNGVDFSPCLGLLVTASGHRRYPLLPTDEADEQRRAQGAEAGGGGGGAKRRRPDGEGQLQEQRQLGPCGINDRACGRDDLAMSSWQPGGLCNSLRLWRLHTQWLPADAAAAVAPAEGEVEADTAAAAAADAGGGGG